VPGYLEVTQPSTTMVLAEDVAQGEGGIGVNVLTVTMLNKQDRT
jgi:hypothetical protein